MKWRYIGVVAVISFIAALVLFPHIIYDKFIWKYFIGPVIADAVGHEVSYHGVVAREGYTIISEILYGLGLVAFIYLLYLFFEKYKINVNMKFILSALPFILYGSIARVLEDMGIFHEPLSYVFISPFIYAQIGILFFLSIIYGLHYKEEKKFVYILVAINIVYVLLYFVANLKLHPAIFILFSIISLLIYHKQKKRDYNASLLSFGMLAFLASLFMLIDSASEFDARILIAPLLAFIITTVIYIPSKYFDIVLLADKLNNLLLFGHMLDAMTTYFAVVDPLHFGISYGEKHPLPDFLMKNFYGIGYPMLKLFVVIAIIYVIDDLKINLKNTIKFFVLFLGLSPGLRDLLRIIVGV